MNNVVCFDMHRDEIVTKEIALARVRKVLSPKHFFDYMYRNMDWTEVTEHLDSDFVAEITNRATEEYLLSRFAAYEVIESE